MRVLLAHNFYRSSAPSGEDTVYREERALLESRGVEVIPYERHSDELNDAGPLRLARSAFESAWSRASQRDIAGLIRRTQPTIAHFHNTFPLISPSVYAACRSAGIPIVQTLHNFRLICPGAMLFRDGQPCEECIDRSLLQSVRHRCYRDSVPATAAVARSIALNRRRGTPALISRYIALTEFARGRFAAGGLPADRIVVKPNGLNQSVLPGAGQGGYVVYVGRLSAEKGLRVLLQAWRTLPRIRLRIVGDGPLRDELERQAGAEQLSVEFMGRLSRQELPAIVGDAAAAIVPSLWYEGFPMVVVEAFASGTPVIASRLGSLAEIVHDGANGALFTPGDAAALAATVARVLANADALAAMRQRARRDFDEHYCADANYRRLRAIYSEAQSPRGDVV
jgi:glycosyltransferase involved in cell wall biosynthesis